MRGIKGCTSCNGTGQQKNLLKKWVICRCIWYQQHNYILCPFCEDVLIPNGNCDPCSNIGFLQGEGPKGCL